VRAHGSSVLVTHSAQLPAGEFQLAETHFEQAYPLTDEEVAAVLPAKGLVSFGGCARN
jgi:hypothetical protein